MKRKTYILTIFIIYGLFLAGEGGFFYFNNKVSIAGAATIQATIKITICGNNIKEIGEQCDNADLGGATCLSRGFAGGILSCAASCDFNTSACTPSGGGGGGGGGGGSSSPPPTQPEIRVIFSGRAYPSSKVTILKDAVIVATTVSGSDANFHISVGNLSSGNYNFTLYGEDADGRRSALANFPLFFTPGVTIDVSGIFISPTISVDKSEVKHGDPITIFGQSVPNSEVTISVSSGEEFFNKIKADNGGTYFYQFDTSVLELGEHLIKSRVAFNGEISSFSQGVGFTVGNQTIVKPEEKEPIKEDINSDGKVNLIDFSILAYWYNRPSPPAAADLNHDGLVNLIDFSILAYYWTG
jgi:hypothetical protein